MLSVHAPARAADAIGVSCEGRTEAASHARRKASTLSPLLLKAARSDSSEPKSALLPASLEARTFDREHLPLHRPQADAVHRQRQAPARRRRVGPERSADRLVPKL
jgi:hypothetical protein